MAPCSKVKFKWLIFSFNFDNPPGVIVAIGSIITVLLNFVATPLLLFWAINNFVPGLIVYTWETVASYAILYLVGNHIFGKEGNNE